jgi:hypothetical protein
MAMIRHTLFDPIAFFTVAVMSARTSSMEAENKEKDLSIARNAEVFEDTNKRHAEIRRKRNKADEAAECGAEDCGDYGLTRRRCCSIPGRPFGYR